MAALFKQTSTNGNNSDLRGQNFIHRFIYSEKTVEFPMSDLKLISPRVGMKFSNYGEVTDFLETYSTRVKQVFVRGRSNEIKSSYLAGKIDGTLKYVNVTFVCKFSKKNPRKLRCDPAGNYSDIRINNKVNNVVS